MIGTRRQWIYTNGQKTWALLKNEGKTVILEIDPPVDGISIHRKAELKPGSKAPYYRFYKVPYC